MRKAFTAWKKIAKIIGSFQASIFFTVLYGIFIIPIGFFRKRRKSTLNNSTFWQKREPIKYTIEWAKKQ